MEVAGKIVCDDFLCFLCKDHGKSTKANGFCVQCSDYLCNTCFENHRKWRLAKDHIFTGKKETSSKMERSGRLDFDMCSAHINESIKFYCPTHDQVGCGDCIILEHKQCAVEYLREKAERFKDSEDFHYYVKRTKACQERAQKIESSIKKNKEKAIEANDIFVKDVLKLKNEIILCVTNLAEKSIQEADNIQRHDVQLMKNLEIEREKLLTDITTMHNAVDLLTDQPNKLFVSTIKFKPILKLLKDKIEDIEQRRKIQIYHFEREEQMERILEKNAVLGSLQRRLVSRETMEAEEDVSLMSDAQSVQSAETSIPVPVQEYEVTRPIDTDQELQADAVAGSRSQNIRYRRCEAMFDFNANHSDELTFRKGEIIQFLRQHDEAEWWEGEIENQPHRKGLFPINFIRPLQQ